MPEPPPPPRSSSRPSGGDAAFTPHVTAKLGVCLEKSVRESGCVHSAALRFLWGHEMHPCRASGSPRAFPLHKGVNRASFRHPTVGTIWVVPRAFHFFIINDASVASLDRFLGAPMYTFLLGIYTSGCKLVEYMTIIKSSPPSPNQSVVDTIEQGGCLQCRIMTSIPGLYPTASSSKPSPPILTTADVYRNLHLWMHKSLSPG